MAVHRRLGSAGRSPIMTAAEVSPATGGGVIGARHQRAVAADATQPATATPISYAAVAATTAT